jgi:hypothetical protein
MANLRADEGLGWDGMGEEGEEEGELLRGFIHHNLTPTHIIHKRTLSRRNAARKQIDK